MSDWEASLRDLRVMQERMNTLLEQSLKGPGPEREELADAVWAPSADAFETDRELLLLIDIAGVAREDVRVDVDGNRLLLCGERRIPDGLDGGDARRVERSYGAFSRAFELPATVDETKITAAHRDGVLVVRLPKRESPRRGQFQVEVE